MLLEHRIPSRRNSGGFRACNFPAVPSLQAAIVGSKTVLFLECAGMTGDTYPLVVQINPSVRESAKVIEGLPFAKSFGVIDSSHHRCVAVHKYLLIRVCHETGRVGNISVVGHELGFRREGPVIVRADEGISQQPVQRLRIVMQLRLIPGIFQRN